MYWQFDYLQWQSFNVNPGFDNIFQKLFYPISSLKSFIEDEKSQWQYALINQFYQCRSTFIIFCDKSKLNFAGFFLQQPMLRNTVCIVKYVNGIVVFLLAAILFLVVFVIYLPIFFSDASVPLGHSCDLNCKCMKKNDHNQTHSANCA